MYQGTTDGCGGSQCERSRPAVESRRRPMSVTRRIRQRSPEVLRVGTAFRLPVAHDHIVVAVGPSIDALEVDPPGRVFREAVVGQDLRVVDEGGRSRPLETASAWPPLA